MDCRHTFSRRKVRTSRIGQNRSASAASEPAASSGFSLEYASATTAMPSRKIPKARAMMIRSARAFAAMALSIRLRAFLPEVPGLT